jgi:hypothetical protein
MTDDGAARRTVAVEVHDSEVIFEGVPLTAERVDEVVAELRAKRSANLRPGGKSLSAPGVHSPTVQFRVPAEVRELAQRIVETDGVSLSKLGRDAFVEAVRKRAAG